MVASWWLVNDIEKPTLGAFKRACTTSLGTICAGSLVVAIIQTVVYLLRQTRGALAAVAACILNLINDLVKWSHSASHTTMPYTRALPHPLNP